VRSLLPDDKATTSSSDACVTPKQLHHLLRLSALPLPKTSEEETKMVDILESQLLFVRDIQSVDTQGVDPLRSIRDETDQGLQEATIGLEQVRHVLSQEVAFGRSKRPRRQKIIEKAPAEVENWNPLHTASDTAGPYFVVRSGKNQGR
jgi:Asp-tRNA(Asn)/Glu-tRNA(Gln) amidotransferase C subunit